MIATGIYRILDGLGRVCLPMEIRKSLNLYEGDKISVDVCGDRITLKKIEDYDVFTGSTQDLIDYKGKKVSRKTIYELAKLAKIVNA